MRAKPLAGTAGRMVAERLRLWYAGTSNGAIVLLVLAVVALLYGALIARALLAAIGVVAPALFLYLFWRFVRAAERAAAAAEGLADAE